MTLVELVIAGGIATLLATAICTSLLHNSRSLVALSNYIEMNQNSRNSLDHLVADIRDFQRVQAYSTNGGNVTLTGTRITNDVSATIAYTWTPRIDAKGEICGTLVRHCTGEPSQLVLTNCELFYCNLYQRTPAGGWELYPTETPSNCKYIRVHWKCKKTIRSANDNLWNTETVQTAGIMLRNQH